MTDCNNAVNFPSLDWKLPIGVEAPFYGVVLYRFSQKVFQWQILSLCCEAMTKECLACKKGITVSEFCRGK